MSNYPFGREAAEIDEARRVYSGWLRAEPKAARHDVMARGLALLVKPDPRVATLVAAIERVLVDGDLTALEAVILPYRPKPAPVEVEDVEFACETCGGQMQEGTEGDQCRGCRGNPNADRDEAIYLQRGEH